MWKHRKDVLCVCFNKGKAQCGYKIPKQLEAAGVRRERVRVDKLRVRAGYSTRQRALSLDVRVQDKCSIRQCAHELVVLLLATHSQRPTVRQQCEGYQLHQPLFNFSVITIQIPTFASLLFIYSGHRRQSITISCQVSILRIWKYGYQSVFLNKFFKVKESNRLFFSGITSNYVLIRCSGQGRKLHTLL